MPILTIYPYLIARTWVFDDAAAGLKEEAFVLGASEMIHRLVEAKELPNAAQGFALGFSSEPFDHDVMLSWVGRDDIGQMVLGQEGTESQIAGNWYVADVAGERMKCWLCPALFLYFMAAPKTIYVKAAALPAGVDPIWHIDRDEPTVRRFVSADQESKLDGQ